MEQPVDKLKQQWEQRQQVLGNTSRAVLFKNFPGVFNNTLHRAHMRFLLANIPVDAAALLDVGCGYGRTAASIKAQRPAITIHGVELCDEFARAFEASIGPCFNGSIGEYESDFQYDAITVITLMMYLSHEEQQRTLRKLWCQLRPGGSMIFIEPCMNFLTRLRRRFALRSLAPTGGEVGYFTRQELADLLGSTLPDAGLINTEYFSMPFVGFPTLHLGAVLRKGQ